MILYSQPSMSILLHESFVTGILYVRRGPLLLEFERCGGPESPASVRMDLNFNASKLWVASGWESPVPLFPDGKTWHSVRLCITEACRIRFAVKDLAWPVILHVNHPATLEESAPKDLQVIDPLKGKGMPMLFNKDGSAHVRPQAVQQRRKPSKTSRKAR